MRCGRNLVRAFLEYYQVTGTIPVSLTSEMSTKRRPKTHRTRPTTRNSTRERPKTTRSQALLHFTDLNIHYDSETSGDELQHSCRNQLSPSRHLQDKYGDKEEHYIKKVGGGGLIAKCGRFGSSPPPSTFVVVPEPSLSIIDFNLITRSGIEEATRKNRHKTHR